MSTLRCETGCPQPLISFIVNDFTKSLSGKVMDECLNEYWFPAAKAACFNLSSDGRIVGWERKDMSGDTDLINIGGYIVEPHADVKEIANDLFSAKNCKEDPFFEKGIQKGIVSG